MPSPAVGAAILSEPSIYWPEQDRGLLYALQLYVLRVDTLRRWLEDAAPDPTKQQSHLIQGAAQAAMATIRVLQVHLDTYAQRHRVVVGAKGQGERMAQEFADALERAKKEYPTQGNQGE